MPDGFGRFTLGINKGLYGHHHKKEPTIGRKLK